MAFFKPPFSYSLLHINNMFSFSKNGNIYILHP